MGISVDWCYSIASEINFEVINILFEDLIIFEFAVIAIRQPTEKQSRVEYTLNCFASLRFARNEN